jgi:hypothetical protein
MTHVKYEQNLWAFNVTCRVESCISLCPYDKRHAQTQAY